MMEDWGKAWASRVKEKPNDIEFADANPYLE